MTIDLRASALDVTGYPGNAHTLTLTWPAGTLAGTTWAATIGGAPVDSVTVNGDNLVLALTIPAVGIYDLVLTQTNVTPDAVKAKGRVRSTETATQDQDSTALTVTLSTATGAVTVVGTGATGATGATGPQGPTGPAGSDATVNATNVAAAGAVMEADTTTAAMAFVVDEDNMASNLATKVPTQQSTKAYVDALSGTYVALAQPVNAQTGTTYTLVVADAGKLVTLSNAAAITLAVPQDSDATIAVGIYVDLLQLGAGQVTVVAGTGATLRVSGLTAKARAQYSRLGVQKIAASTWSLYGDLAAS